MWKYFRPCSLNKSFLFNSTLAIEYNIQAMPFDPSLCAISFALYLETSILQELDSVLCSRHEISLVSTPYRSGNSCMSTLFVHFFLCLISFHFLEHYFVKRQDSSGHLVLSTFGTLQFEIAGMHCAWYSM